ncbi:hypothetical protein BCV72DRAFT_219748 [Rhizopus microsporus var. microsporus]|uniref:Uncharacterized protein n=2 Tax=Rhizopus microsporus TaxID=58291 RepID=A0A2G4STQ6_RHIZD|nr:uncharacterized protein RHIMIDRAFT_284109 [Rhizopus microsporus ATCC 52813]ORE11574.1 hypothetical protein BCV72DRAFT_219748 [Rhizopus microsporus var. microsporus]PHZ12132.1 hypothetical protein RHIMIDRAFT_284109 [Rhizopus microsporus ATCC 52813]
MAITQGEIPIQKGACSREIAFIQEQNEESAQGEESSGCISKTLDLLESTPNQYPSITTSGRSYLHSQSAPNLRWFHV